MLRATWATLGSKGGTGKSTLNTAIVQGLALCALQAGDENSLAVQGLTDEDAEKNIQDWMLFDQVDIRASNPAARSEWKQLRDDPRAITFVIDGGANRLAEDLAIAKAANLILMPVTNSAKPLREIANDIKVMVENGVDASKIWITPNAWPADVREGRAGYLKRARAEARLLYYLGEYPRLMRPVQEHGFVDFIDDNDAIVPAQLTKKAWQAEKHLRDVLISFNRFSLELANDVEAIAAGTYQPWQPRHHPELSSFDPEAPDTEQEGADA